MYQDLYLARNTKDLRVKINKKTSKTCIFIADTLI